MRANRSTFDGIRKAEPRKLTPRRRLAEPGRLTPRRRLAEPRRLTPRRRLAEPRRLTLLLGVFGVACFSMTFPATVAAEASFSPLEVGVGRSVIAAVVAAIVLAVRRQPLLPPRSAMPAMLVVAATVGVGFGLLSAIALRQVSSVHGAVLTGLIPAATAGMAVLRAGERPRPAYWAALAAGLAVVVGFALVQGGGRLTAADTLLLVAIAVAGVGYAEGGILAREHGGWRVICWALLLALPVTGPVTLGAVLAGHGRPVEGAAIAGLCYVGIVSMCVGFFAWYHAMATGGVARVGRLQLAQPALTLGWSALLLGEHVGLTSAIAAAAVVVATAVGRNAGAVSPAGSGGRWRAIGTGPAPGGEPLTPERRINCIIRQQPVSTADSSYAISPTQRSKPGVSHLAAGCRDDRHRMQ